MKKILALALALALALGIQAQRRLAYTAKSTIDKESVDFRVYNNANGKGFVILGDEDVLGENNVLGYSDTGSFDYDNLSESAKWWLSQYQLQMADLRAEYKTSKPQNLKTSKPRLLSSVNAATVVVQPLLTAKWGQGSPFNMNCPKVNNKSTYTGCVATAMSQIMYFWKWPQKGHGQHSYQWNNQTLTGDFSKSIYEWKNMIDKYSQTTVSYKKQAVARLVADAGISVEMNYGTNGSGALSFKVPIAFETYFSYDEGVEYVTRTSANTAKWDDMLKKELDAGRPVFYSGVDTQSGGHAFVCDGYDDADYFHFNFGWNGDDNAYFKTSILGPAQGYYFNTGQDAVIGIKPRTVKEVDGLSYTLRNNGTAVVTYPDLTNYTGEIVIPATITVEGKTYKVTGIQSGAFADCTGVTKITIPWSTVPEITGETFSDECYNAELVVPAGSLDKYLYADDWYRFRKFSDANGKSVTWSEWEKVLDGVGTYTYTDQNPLLMSSLIEKTANNLPIVSRTSDDVADTQQFRIDGWNYNSDLMIVYNTKTKQCVVPKQDSGWKSAPIFGSDFPTYNSTYKYSQYPCTYNPGSGLFSLNIVYYESVGKYGSGLETFQVKGLEDNAMSVIIDDNQTFNKRFGLTLSYGTAITTACYKRFEGKLSEEAVADSVAKIVDGTISSTQCSKGTSKYSVSDVNKDYTFVFVGFSQNGEQLKYENHCYITVNYNVYVDIEDVEANAKAKANGIYTISGQKVNNEGILPKGIYIVNGRKVMIK